MGINRSGINQLAVLWGLAEATAFFIVPDVFLSYVGRNKLRVGIIACWYSLLGALIGGLIMYYWGNADQTTANQLLDNIPAIDMKMINRVNEALSEQGIISVLFGPLSGTPYKIYAVQAAGQGVSLWLFLLISIPARVIRFILVTVLFHFALKVINQKVSKGYNLKILFVSWASFYTFYFWVMGW